MHVLAHSCQQTCMAQPCRPRVQSQSLIPVLKEIQSSRGVSHVGDCNTHDQNENTKNGHTALQRSKLSPLLERVNEASQRRSSPLSDLEEWCLCHMDDKGKDQWVLNKCMCNKWINSFLGQKDQHVQGGLKLITKIKKDALSLVGRWYTFPSSQFSLVLLPFYGIFLFNSADILKVQFKRGILGRKVFWSLHQMEL